MKTEKLALKVLSKREVRTGNRRDGNGTWSAQAHVCETISTNPEKFEFDVWNNEFQLNEGDEIEATFYVNSHEYNGRIYVGLKVDTLDVMKPFPVTPVAPKQEPQPIQAQAAPADNTQLPF